MPAHRLFLLGIEDGPKGRHYLYSVRVLRGTQITLSREHDEYRWLSLRERVEAPQEHNAASHPAPRRDATQPAL